MTITLSPDVKAAVDIALAKPPRCERLEEALDTQIQLVVEATKKSDASAARKAELAADLAEETNDAKARAIETLLKKTTAELAADEKELEHLKGVESALRARLKRTEDELRAEAVVMQAVSGQHADDVTRMIADELAQAARPLLAALRRAAVLQTAIHSRPLGQMLSETLVGNPALFRQPIVEGLRTYANGACVDLLADWRSDAALVADHTAASAPRLAHAKLAGYVTRAAREKSSIKQPLRGVTVESIRARLDANKPTPDTALDRARAKMMGPAADGEMGHQLVSDTRHEVQL